MIGSQSHTAEPIESLTGLTHPQITRRRRMPYTKEQQGAAKVALYSPEKLRKENKGMMSMSRKELQAMAAGKHGTKKSKKHIGRMVKQHRADD